MLLSLALGAPVVAPMVEVAPYEPLRDDQLTLVDWPDALLHEGMVRDPAEVVGRYALEPLYPGEPVRTERLATLARDALLGPDEDLVVLDLGGAQVWSPGRVDLVVDTPDGACLLAQDLRSHGSPAPGQLALTAAAPRAHVLRWAATQAPRLVVLARNPTDRSRLPLACALDLVPHVIALPSGGSSMVAFDHPVRSVAISHPDRVGATLADEGRLLWLRGLDPRPAAITVHTGEGRAPFVLDVRPDPPVPPEAVVPRGGLVEVGRGAEVLVFPEGSARVERVGDRVFLAGLREGPVEALLVGPSGPRIWRGQVQAPASGMPMAVGKRRALLVEPGSTVLVGDPEVILVETRGSKKLRLTGRAPGSSALWVIRPDGRVGELTIQVQ